MEFGFPCATMETVFERCIDELPCYVVFARKLKAGSGAVSEILKRGFDDNDVLVLFRVVDIAKALNRDYAETYRELTRHFVVPVIPLHCHKRYWFAVACDGLRRFFEVSGRKDLAAYVNRCQGSLQFAFLEISDLAQVDDRVVSLLACLGSVWQLVERYLDVVQSYRDDPSEFEELHERLIDENYRYFVQRRWVGFWEKAEPSDADYGFERMLALSLAIEKKTQNALQFRRFGSFYFVRVPILRAVCWKLKLDCLLDLFEGRFDGVIASCMDRDFANSFEVSSVLANLHKCEVSDADRKRQYPSYICRIVQQLLDAYGNNFGTNRIAWHKFFAAASSEVEFALERFASDRLIDHRLANSHFLAAVDAARKVACRIYWRLFVFYKDKRRKFKNLPKTEKPQKALEEGLKRAQEVLTEALDSFVKRYCEAARCWKIAVRLGDIRILEIPREAIFKVKEFLRTRQNVKFVNKMHEFVRVRTFVSQFIERFGFRGLVALLEGDISGFFSKTAQLTESLRLALSPYAPQEKLPPKYSFI